MRKFLLITAIVTSMIAQSCSKESDTLSTTNFNVEEAKAAFVNNYTNALGTKSADEVYYSLAGGDYTPVWEMAKASENEHIWSLEVPIISDLQIVLKNKETDLVTSAERKLLFVKSKETQNVHPFIMVSTTSETKSNNNSYEHLADNASYSGYVLYSTLAGEFVNLRSYDNGVEIANVNAMTVEMEHQRDCDSICTGHEHNHSLENVLGGNEFGVMPLGMGGEYFEGFCIWCGAAFPDCWCDDGFQKPVLCLECGGNYLTCGCGKTVCDKCGKLKDFCSCDLTSDEYLCGDCGNYHSPGDCKYTCTKCGKHISYCVCK